MNTRFYFVVIFLFSCPLLIKLEAKLMDDLHCERPLIRAAAGRCTSWWWAHKKLGKKRTIYVFFHHYNSLDVNYKKKKNTKVLSEWWPSERPASIQKGSLIMICLNPFYSFYPLYSYPEVTVPADCGTSSIDIYLDALMKKKKKIIYIRQHVAFY